ncbi:hypothetical protein BJY52DRAFT_1317056 [Lactarius psammicola]|nr:hypothetical protein BJY52DRAFT_1317056 [Lactarius psammicola]
MTNECWAIPDVVANSSGHVRSMTQETKILCSTSGATKLRTMFQVNQAPLTSDSCKHLAVPLDQVAPAPVPASKLCALPDRGTRAEKTTKKPYQCGYCCVGFAQRQGLTRHKKDKHKNKIRCEFCPEFTWPQGRRYVYHKHLQKKHPGVVSPSVGATPIALNEAST